MRSFRSTRPQARLLGLGLVAGLLVAGILVVGAFRGTSTVGLQGLASASQTPSGLVTDVVGPLKVRHPSAWRVVPGPGSVAGRTVPVAYLSNGALTVATCASVTPQGESPGCPLPLASLPPTGVLVTIEPNLGLAEMAPPQVYVIVPDGRCTPLGADAEAWSVAAGAVVTGCFRGPGELAAETDFTNLVNAIQGELDVNRFELGTAAP